MQRIDATTAPASAELGRLEPRCATATTGYAHVIDGPKPPALEWDDEDDESADKCPHCRGDGMDPDCDYLLPCPDCGGSW